MEEYHRDSLRELRRLERDDQKTQKVRGSRFITLLIILMFLAAGGFYLKTAQPAWLTKRFDFAAVQQKIVQWKDDIVATIKGEDATDVQQTVDGVLENTDEKA